MTPPAPPPSTDPIERFIARWQGHEGGQERANYALFLTELCDALGLDHPDVAAATHEFNDYVFERAVRHQRDTGESIGRTYGWPQTLSDEKFLERLVALNHERAAKERRGHVRWLRPDYQVPRFGKTLDKMAAKEEQVEADLGIAASGAKTSFPADAVAQTAAVFAAIASSKDRITVSDIASGYRKSKNLEKNISEVLASLTRLGHVTTRDGETFEIRRGR